MGVIYSVNNTTIIAEYAVIKWDKTFYINEYIYTFYKYSPEAESFVIIKHLNKNMEAVNKHECEIEGFVKNLSTYLLMGAASITYYTEKDFYAEYGHYFFQ